MLDGTPPIRLGGAALRAPKRFVDGTHRCVAPGETLARVRPLLGRAGITRLADVSGLDRVGVTTVVAVRPNALTLSTSAGKGFSRDAALVSAAMEALEMHHAEHPRLPRRVASYAELAADGEAVIPLDKLPLTRRSLFSPDRPEAWVRAWDLVALRDTWVPFMSAALVRPPTQRTSLDKPFQLDSNGLASGNHLLEAACAAIYEVIERDAVTCHRVAERRAGHRAPLVDLGALAFPRVRELLARFAAAGLRASARDCTVDTAVPVYMAHLVDERTRRLGIFGGWGAHLDPEVALVRALTEAAQSRAVYISGSRDDIFRNDERKARFEDTPDAVRLLDAPGSAGRPAPARVSAATPTFEGDCAVLLERLRAAGVGQVLLVDLTRDDFGIPVVRAIVPGLEGYTSPDYVTGPRAAAFAAAHAAAHADVHPTPAAGRPRA